MPFGAVQTEGHIAVDSLVLCDGVYQLHPVLSSLMVFAHSPDAPKDSGGSEILKYLLEITDGTSEGDTSGTLIQCIHTLEFLSWCGQTLSIAAVGSL